MLAIRRITGFHGVLCWFDMKYLQFLAHIFLDYKMSFRCFDWLSALSAKDGCYTRFIRGTKNFETYCVLPGNRCKFTSMFICTSLTHPCASVAWYYLKFQMPLTVLIMPLKLTNRAVTFFSYTNKLSAMQMCPQAL